mgnify:CR=1 FL=1
MYKNILVALEAPMDMHRANSGQNQLGNATAIKRRPDGRVYVSGQMQRHAFFEALKQLDESDETYVSPGSATTHHIGTDLRADLGGFLQTDFSGLGDAARRTAPLSATPAVAKEPSQRLRDLLLQLKSDSDKQNIATVEMSQSDLMQAAYSLDCTSLTTSTQYDIAALNESDEKSRGVCVGENVVAHASPDERLRRAQLMLQATRYVNAHASQARNMSALEPQRVCIVLDPVISRKAARYFKMSTEEQTALRNELTNRGATVFIGDDEDESERTVAEAYEAAADELAADGIYQEDWPVKSYEETYEGVADLLSE